MQISTRVEVWRWIFVRNAVKCGEKNNFHRVFLTSFCGECGESRWIIFFSPRSQYSYKKQSSLHGFEPLTSCMPSNAYSTAPTVTFLYVISCEFKSDWVNFGNHMRWIFVRNAVKCGELFFFTASSGEKKKFTAWEKAVNYFFSPHSPHSPHFLH